MPEEALEACVPFFFLLHPCPLDTSQFLQHHSGESALIRRWRTLRKEVGRWEPHHQETWSPQGFSKLLQPRGSTSFGCSSHSFTAGGPSWIWRLWARAEGSRLARSTRRGSLAGKSFPALSTPSESILGKQACPGFRALITAQITMAGME